MIPSIHVLFCIVSFDFRSCYVSFFFSSEESKGTAHVISTLGDLTSKILKPCTRLGFFFMKNEPYSQIILYLRI